jgi:hypothetical protein
LHFHSIIYALNSLKKLTQHGEQLEALALVLVVVHHHCVPLVAHFGGGQPEVGAETVDNQGAAGVVDLGVKTRVKNV